MLLSERIRQLGDSEVNKQIALDADQLEQERDALLEEIDRLNNIIEEMKKNYD